MMNLDFSKQIKAALESQEGSEEVISEEAWAAEKGKGKKLNKPFRTPGGPKNSQYTLRMKKVT